MPECEQSINDVPVSAAQPANTDKVLFTRANGTSYLMSWSVMLGWIQAAAGGATPPTANAGADGNITLPTSSISLIGSGTGGSGTITSYLWTKVSGPAGGTIASPNSASTNVTGLGQGNYIFRLTVTNSNNQTAQDDVSVTVNAAAATFGTDLTFSAANTNSAAGVSAAIATVNAGYHFEFNALVSTTGTPMTMNIYVSGILEMVVDFPSDYLGQQCRFTKAGSPAVLISFTNGNVNL